MTIASLMKAGKQRLGDSQTALLDVEVILQHVLGVEKEYLLMNSEQEVDDDLQKLFEAYIERVISGEPVAHITGDKEFFALSFFVDKRVLIPRPETEFLVEYAIKYLSELSEQVDRRFKVLDVGTGSGNIAVSLAHYFQARDWDILDEILAFDVSFDALEVARINASQHAVENLIEFVESDLLEVVDEGAYFDVILANLPYIGLEKYRFVGANVEKYEPGVALFGGVDGLQLYKKMFQQIRDKNLEFGVLLGEFGFAQSEDLATLLKEYFGEHWSIKTDLAGIDRFFIIQGNA